MALQGGYNRFALTPRKKNGAPEESPDAEGIFKWSSMTSKVLEKWQGPGSTQNPKGSCNLACNQVWKLDTTPGGRSGTAKVNLVTPREMLMSP